MVFPCSTLFLSSNPSFLSLALAIIVLSLVKCFLTERELIDSKKVDSISEIHDNSTLEYPLPNMWQYNQGNPRLWKVSDVFLLW